MTATVRAQPPSRTGGRPGGRPPAHRLWTSGWPLLPLRLFLGITFLYAGLQKFADPRFLRAGAPGSVQAQLHAAVHTSPIGSLLGGLAGHGLVVGVAIALAEVAVGIGALLGLWTRAAAAGGLALSIGFLLTVSWHSHPYYLGPDIVFAAAWVPLVLAGAGDDPRLSLDARVRRQTRTSMGLPPAEEVPVAFATVQRLCRGYEAGRCRYRHGAPCGPEFCPVLAAPAVADRATEDTFDRRTFLRRTQLAGLTAVGGLAAAAVTARVGRLLDGGAGGRRVAALDQTGAGSGGPGPTGPAGPPAAPPGPAAPGVAIGPARALPVGGVASFTDPGGGTPAYVVQPRAGEFKAFSAVCPHAGCQVQYASGAHEFVCPCHGARFDATGTLVQGPARRSLDPITVARGADGQLYVDG